jgi:hypothetical protein
MERCKGKMRNGPDKRYTRCTLCGRLDYETNEGDPCPYFASRTKTRSKGTKAAGGRACAREG